jgi:NAD(P)-dependent dehydrogenase (short-subunit alcohol dehydrogenase family)
MVRSGTEGSVFTITSVNAIQPGVGLAAYGASKAALEAFMKGAALEMAAHNIKINTIAVGAVQTAMTEAVWKQPALLEQVEAAIPMGRLGQPEEVAEVIAGLIKANSYMTGATITIDGGWMMGQGFARPKPYGS